MPNFIQKEDLGTDFTNDNSLAAGGVGVDKSQLVSADANNQLATGTDDGLFVPEVPDASATVTGVVNNTSMQELGGADKTIHGVRVGRGGGGVVTNTALGINALLTTTTANNCVALGFSSLGSNTSGANNTAVGRDSLLVNGTGNSNTAVGYSAGSSNITGGLNTAVGVETLLSAVDSYNNAAVGAYALRDTTTGLGNAAVGMNALRANTLGSNSVAVGFNALRDATEGDNNVGVGRGAGGPQSPFTVTTEDHRIVMGNNDHTNAYINVPWTVASDERRKTAIAPVPHGLDFVNKLDPIEFQFRKWEKVEEVESTPTDDDAETPVPRMLDEGDGRARYGFSAQRVRALEGDKPVITDCEDEDFLKLQETYLIPVLVNAIKELSRKVEALEQNQK